MHIQSAMAPSRAQHGHDNADACRMDHAHETGRGPVCVQAQLFMMFEQRRRVLCMSHEGTGMHTVPGHGSIHGGQYTRHVAHATARGKRCVSHTVHVQTQKSRPAYSSKGKSTTQCCEPEYLAQLPARSHNHAVGSKVSMTVAVRAVIVSTVTVIRRL
jgi:hypothetical protein